ncbi:nuclear transport factor 2 family protein [Mycobacterium sp. pUA109]|uniref:nuclear transport factor 2 family protein n=1 Tax=Mycobacterium sp. pUA109 TaxID=3238982 RepID=UPI00351B14CE
MSLAVADRLALADLVHRYAAGVDDREFGAVAQLFTATAELIVPEAPATLEPVRAHRGRDAIAAALAAVTTVTRTQHAVVGEVYDPGPAPGAARGRIAGIAHHWTQRADGDSDLIWYLRYRDDYQLTDAGWLIRRRALTIDAIETRPARRVRGG